jgi:hypothetical protein
MSDLPDLKKLREVAQRAISPGEEWYDAWQMRQILMHEARVNEPALSGDVTFITEITPQVVIDLLDAYEASARDANRLRDALVNIEQWASKGRHEEDFEAIENAARHATKGE